MSQADVETQAHWRREVTNAERQRGPGRLRDGVRGSAQAQPEAGRQGREGFGQGPQQEGVQ
eukprot:5582020-Alexandrium_andersonii.AAC.1